MKAYLVWWTGIDPESGVPIAEGGEYPIKNLNFAPQTDLTGNSLPINEYSCDVITEGMYSGITTEAVTNQLQDEHGVLWANWPIYKVVKITNTCFRVTFRSWISQLDYIEMAETVYQGETAEEVVADIIPYGMSYSMADSLKSITLNGYAPAQTARERLTWVLFTIGGYVRDIFVSEIQILKVDTTEALIPIDRTFMRPSIDRADWVTGLKITTYSFFQAASDEAAAEYDNSYMFPLPWVATENTVTLTNPAAPADAPKNVIEINGIYLVNPNNVSAIASRLAEYWFNPMEASLDCVNNRQYRPGDLVTVYTSREDMLTGYVQQTTFKFGKQARSTLKLIGCEVKASSVLRINYTHNGRRIARDEFRFPVGFGYSLPARYIDQTTEDHRYIYRPTIDTITGTMVDGGSTVTVPCEIALDLYDGILHIISVDEVTEQSSGGETIGVIS